MEIRYYSSTLGDMLEGVENGTLLVPSFQRSFTWKSKDIARLWTSIIIRDEPMGSFVLWKTTKGFHGIDETNKYFKEIRGDKEPNNQNYLIDGQQRMTSFAVSYLLNIKPNYKISKSAKGNSIYLDLRGLKNIKEIDKVKFSWIEKPNDKQIISVSLLWLEKKTLQAKLEHEITINTFNDWEEKDIIKLINEIVNISDKLKRINLGITEIKTNEIDKVIDVFSLINTKGRKLSVFNIVHSLFTKVDKKFNLNEEFENINSKIEDELKTDKWKISESLLLTLLYVLKNKTIKNGTITKLAQENIEDTRKKIEYIKSDNFQNDVIDTVKVLMDLGFKSQRLLPSNIYINVVGWYIKQLNNKMIGSSDKDRLNNFFKLAILNNRHTSGEEGLKENGFKEDLDFLLSENKEPKWTVKRSFTGDDIIAEEYEGTGAKAKFIIAKMIDNLRSFASGNIVSYVLENKYKNNLHHIFPKKSSFKHEKKYINSLANITPLESGHNKNISNTEPKDYFTISKYKFEYGLIDSENFSDLEKFVQERAQKIADKMNDDW